MAGRESPATTVHGRLPVRPLLFDVSGTL